METEDLFRGGVGLLHQSIGTKHQNAGGEIGKHGLTEMFRGAGPPLLHLILQLQLMLLLFQLLYNRVVKMKGKGFELGGGAGIDNAFGRTITAPSADQPACKHERNRRTEESESLEQ